MKTKIFTALLLLLIAFSSSVNAQKASRSKPHVTPLSVEVSIADSSMPKYMVKVNNPAGLNVSIEVIQDRGAQLSLTASKQNNFSQLIDFSQAVDGVYVLVVSDGITTVRKNLLLKTSVVTLRAANVE